MSDPAIISDSQLILSDGNPSISQLRTSPSGTPSLSTSAAQLNITILMTSANYPITPQMGRIDISSVLSLNVAEYLVYYKSPGQSDFTPFTRDLLSGVAEVFTVTEAVIFPAGVYVDEIRLVFNRVQNADRMYVKFDLYACFESPGKRYVYTIWYAVINCLFYQLFPYNIRAKFNNI